MNFEPKMPLNISHATFVNTIVLKCRQIFFFSSYYSILNALCSDGGALANCTIGTRNKKPKKPKRSKGTKSK